MRVNGSRHDEPTPRVENVWIVVSIDELAHRTEINDGLSFDGDESAFDQGLRGPSSDEVGVVDDHDAGKSLTAYEGGDELE